MCLISLGSWFIPLSLSFIPLSWWRAYSYPQVCMRTTKSGSACSRRSASMLVWVVGHDAFRFVTPLILTSGISHPCVWHQRIHVFDNSFMCLITHSCVWHQRIHVFDISACVWHQRIFQAVHMDAVVESLCGITHSDVRHGSFLYATFLIHRRDSDVTHCCPFTEQWNTRVTWLIQLCDMTRVLRGGSSTSVFFPFFVFFFSCWYLCMYLRSSTAPHT